MAFVRFQILTNRWLHSPSTIVLPVLLFNCHTSYQILIERNICMGNGGTCWGWHIEPTHHESVWGYHPVIRMKLIFQRDSIIAFSYRQNIFILSTGEYCVWFVWCHR
jgi:hypothetical protein